MQRGQHAQQGPQLRPPKPRTTDDDASSAAVGHLGVRRGRVQVLRVGHQQRAGLRGQRRERVRRKSGWRERRCGGHDQSTHAEAPAGVRVLLPAEQGRLRRAGGRTQRMRGGMALMRHRSREGHALLAGHARRSRECGAAQPRAAGRQRRRAPQLRGAAAGASVSVRAKGRSQGQRQHMRSPARQPGPESSVPVPHGAQPRRTRGAAGCRSGSVARRGPGGTRKRASSLCRGAAARTSLQQRHAGHGLEAQGGHGGGSESVCVAPASRRRGPAASRPIQAGPSALSVEKPPATPGFSPKMARQQAWASPRLWRTAARARDPPPALGRPDPRACGLNGAAQGAGASRRTGHQHLPSGRSPTTERRPPARGPRALAHRWHPSWPCGRDDPLPTPHRASIGTQERRRPAAHAMPCVDSSPDVHRCAGARACIPRRRAAAER